MRPPSDPAERVPERDVVCAVEVQGRATFVRKVPVRRIHEAGQEDGGIEGSEEGGGELTLKSPSITARLLGDDDQHVGQLGADRIALPKVRDDLSDHVHFDILLIKRCDLLPTPLITYSKPESCD